MELGFGELIVILAIVLVLFGAGRLPQLGKGLGEAMKGFRESLRGAGEPPAPAPKKELPPQGQGGEK